MDKRKTKVAPKGTMVSEKVKKSDDYFPEGDQEPAGKDAKKKKPAKKYASGGKVRGTGCAKKGARKAKTY